MIVNWRKAQQRLFIFGRLVKWVGARIAPKPVVLTLKTRSLDLTLFNRSVNLTLEERD